MKIYRGDSVPNGCGRGTHRGRTLAEYCISEGLFAKFADKGSNSFLDGNDFLDMVLAHVGYEKNTPEEIFSYHSPFLSFTACLSTAQKFSFSRAKKSAEFKECDFAEATNFVWELDFEKDAEEEQPGVYKLDYKSSSVNFVKYLENYVAELNVAVLNSRSFNACHSTQLI
jgi:hypothetical protein